MKIILTAFMTFLVSATGMADSASILSCSVDGEESVSQGLEVYEAEGRFASERAELILQSEDGTYKVTAAAFRPLEGNEQTPYDQITIFAENQTTKTTTIVGDPRIAVAYENTHFRVLTIYSELPDGSFGPGVHVECRLNIGQ